MRFDKLRKSFPDELQLNAGILLDTFNPSSPESITGTEIIGVTSGGSNFVATPEFKDMGEDIDNCPKNLKQLKKLVSWEVTLSGTFKTVTGDLAARLTGAADLAMKKITPRNDLKDTDFKDIWWVGDYGKDHTAENGGFIAIHLMNGLSTVGFQIQTEDDEKGSFPFTITGHYDMDSAETVPFEIYVEEGGAA